MPYSKIAIENLHGWKLFISVMQKKKILKLAQLVCNLLHCTGNQNIDQFCSLQTEL